MGVTLNRLFSALLLGLVLIAPVACHKAKPAAEPTDPQIENLKALIAKAHYEEAAKKAKEIVSLVPPAPGVPEALYLESYALIFGEKDYPGARLALKQLLDFFPQSPHAMQAQQWIGDCHFWEGNYDRALREYRRLEGAGKDYAPYALYQEANCLLLKDKVGDALTAYRDLIEKYPASPLADTAQLMVANTYLKLDDRTLAKTELQKFMSLSKNPDLVHAAQKALRQLEEEETFRKGVGVQQ
jgi:TolA-binding protein